MEKFSAEDVDIRKRPMRRLREQDRVRAKVSDDGSTEHASFADKSNPSEHALLSNGNDGQRIPEEAAVHHGR